MDQSDQVHLDAYVSTLVGSLSFQDLEKRRLIRFGIDFIKDFSFKD